MKLRSEHKQLQSCHYRADGHTMNMLREDIKESECKPLEFISGMDRSK